jgi:hypothetical protein
VLYFLIILFVSEYDFICFIKSIYCTGWDIFAPSVDVVKHEYVRKESPKFWESVGALFHDGAVHNQLTDLVLNRIKRLLQYKDFVEEPPNVMTRVNDYGLGSHRPLANYFEVLSFYLLTWIVSKTSPSSFLLYKKIAGIDVQKMTTKIPKWCSSGELPAYYIGS